MATARPAETEETAATPPPPKPPRPRGRPRTRGIAPVETEAIEIPEEPAEIAARPSSGALDQNTTLEFFDLLQAYDPADWSSGGLIAYLYRTAPVIDRSRTGQDYNLQKFTRAFDADEIMKAAYGGSGGYKILLRRFNAKTRHTDPIRDYFFRILNYEYPPRIPAGDWLDSENNREWQWARPKLEALARAEAVAAQQLNGAPAAGPSDDKVLNLVRELLPAARKDEAQSIAEAVVTAIQRDRPQTSAGLENIVLTLLNRDSDSGGMAALRAEVAAARQRADELMIRLLDRATGPASAPRSLLAELKELAEAKDVLGNIFGRGARPAADTKLEWPEVGMRVADSFIKMAPNIVQAFTLGKAGIRQPARPAAPPTNGAPQIPGSEQPIESPEEIQEMIRNISNSYGPMFDEVTPFLSNYFVRGATGMQFRDWLIEEYGRRAYDGLRQLHAQTIADVIELRKTEAPENIRPQLAQLTPREKLIGFIAQFLSDEPAEYEEVAEQHEPPQPAAANGRGPGGF